MTVCHVAAHVRHVDVPVGMLRVRLGLADEHAALKAAHICVPLSRDDHQGPSRSRLARRECIAGSRGLWPPTADHRRKHCNAFSSE
jgi:hypothetical protein